MGTATSTVADSSLIVPAVPRRRGRRKIGVLEIMAGIALTFMVFLAVAAPLAATHDPLAMAPARAFQGPSRDFLMGSDEFGRDLFSRIVYGTRISLGTAAVVVVMASLIGIPLGLLAGYFGGVVDALIMRLVDAILAFPAILLAMGLIAVLGQGWANSMIAVIIVSIPAFARLVRATTLQQHNLEYVLAARAMGATDLRIMLRTILPNCIPSLLPQIAINASFAVLLEASLSFLGLGPKPPTPSWGQMLNGARLYLYRAPWYGLFPGVFLTLLVLSLNILADGAQRFLSRGKIQ